MTTMWMGRPAHPSGAWEVELGRRVRFGDRRSAADRLLVVVGGEGPPLCGRDEGLLIRPWLADLDHVAERPGAVFVHRIPLAVWRDLAAGRRDRWTMDDLVGHGPEDLHVAAHRADLFPQDLAAVTG